MHPKLHLSFASRQASLAHFFSPIIVIQVILLSLVQPTALVFLQDSIIFHLFCQQLLKATPPHCQGAHIKCNLTVSALSSHCKPAQASQGSYWLFLDPPGQAILVAWLPNTMHQPNQSTWDSGNDELPQDLSCSLPSISSRGTFFSQPIWKIPVVSQIFSWGVISLLKSTLISLGHVQLWYPMDKFCI